MPKFINCVNPNLHKPELYKSEQTVFHILVDDVL